MVPDENSAYIWKFEGYELDELRRELHFRGTRVPLEAKLFDLLSELVRHAGEVVTREHLYEAVWPGIKRAQDSLTTAISKLRGVLDNDTSQMILTVAGVGYKFVKSVTAARIEAVPVETRELREGEAVPGRDQWKLKRSLGSSADSVVWLCQHVKTGEARIFKFAFDGIRLRRLRREVTVARLLARLAPEGHEFVRALEWNFETAPYFLETEYGGPNLLQWIEERGGLSKIPLADRLDILAKAARSVAVAHNIGVIHKDLKPANILICADGGDLHVQVCDFDSAWITEPSRLEALQITNAGFGDARRGDENDASGTLLYLAPEVLRGEAPSISSDVYALGIMLYQLVVGEFRAKLSAGWEVDVEDPLIREDIAAAANGSPELRPSAAALAQGIVTIEQRRAERRRQEALHARARTAERKLAAARAKRPWVVLATTALAVGCIISLFYFHRAAQERDRANRESARFAAMYRFLSNDLLGQDDPFRSESALESLNDAVKRSSPDIDRQFQNDPLIGGRLHLTIATTLDERASYREARREYERAISLFLSGEGRESPDAIVARLREAAMIARSNEPGTLDLAKSFLKSAELAISRSTHPSDEMELWRLRTRGVIAILESNPHSAVENFSAALRRAEAIRFDESFRQQMKTLLAYGYIRLADGARAEEILRPLVRESAQARGAESVRTLRLRARLLQSLFVQGKYAAVIQEADAIYPPLLGKLGESHELTLAVLGSRAASEGHLGLWDRAIGDDLIIYKLAVQKQGPVSFFSVATLSDAGLSQCHAGRYTDGEVNTRKAFELPGQLPKQSGMRWATSYALAYCLIGQNKITEASRYLGEIDVQTVTHLTGEPSVGADVALAQGEIAVRQRNYSLARQYAETVSQAFGRFKADESDRQELAKLEKEIQMHTLVVLTR